MTNRLKSPRLQARLETQQHYSIVITCAWCKRRMRVQPTDFPPPYSESHGICQACCTRLETEFKLGKDVLKRVD